jgi:hypothetical protein
MNTAGLLVAGLLITLQVLATLLEVEAWPFSAYAMYSHDWRVDAVVTYRVRLVLADGSVIWWEPQLAKDKQTFSVQFARLLQVSADAGQFGRSVHELFERLVIPDLIRPGEPGDRYRKIQVLERRVSTAQAALTIDDRLVFSMLARSPATSSG